MPTSTASIATHHDLERRGSPAKRLVSNATHDAVSWSALAAAATAPLIGVRDTAREDGTLRLETLAGRLQPELVEPAKLGQVRTGEGSVRQVGVFWMDGVGTSIIGRPRPLPGHRPRIPRYTLIWGEPHFHAN